LRFRFQVDARNDLAVAVVYVPAAKPEIVIAAQHLDFADGGHDHGASLLERLAMMRGRCGTLEADPVHGCPHS
jgi:hypothetical protein